jgi:hypothetical protein
VSNRAGTDQMMEKSAPHYSSLIISDFIMP